MDNLSKPGSNGVERAIVGQQATLNYKNNGVDVMYSFAFPDGTSPFDIVEFLDRMCLAIDVIGDSVVTQAVRRLEVEGFQGTCRDCGETEIVSFKPRANKPFYCNKCYQRHMTRKG